MFSVCQNSSCGYNYLRVGGRDGRLYLLDTTGDRFDEITVSWLLSHSNWECRTSLCWASTSCMAVQILENENSELGSKHFQVESNIAKNKQHSPLHLLYRQVLKLLKQTILHWSVAIHNPGHGYLKIKKKRLFLYDFVAPLVFQSKEMVAMLVWEILLLVLF